MRQVRETAPDCWARQEQALDLVVRPLQGAEMKQTQYARILAALRKAGRKGCTNHDLMVYSNCPWKRIGEMETAWTLNNDKERIVRDSKQVNGRTVRVYRLERA
jgi:hypothetical protein